MSDPVVTISGQRVYPHGYSPTPNRPEVRPDARDPAGRLLARTSMAPAGWASGGNEEAVEAGLPFVGALVAVIVIAIVAVVFAKRRR